MAQHHGPDLLGCYMRSGAMWMNETNGVGKEHPGRGEKGPLALLK